MKSSNEGCWKNKTEARKEALPAEKGYSLCEEEAAAERLQPDRNVWRKLSTKSNEKAAAEKATTDKKATTTGKTPWTKSSLLENNSWAPLQQSCRRETDDVMVRLSW